LIIGLVGFVGFVGSMLALLVPAFGGLWAIYSLRGMTWFFVAAVVPVVSALIADHTPLKKCARRFALLGGMSLLGILVGSGLIDIINWFGSLIGQGAWLHQFRRLRVRYERLPSMHRAIMQAIQKQTPPKRSMCVSPAGQRMLNQIVTSVR
jgi:MFS family permease